MAYNKAFIKRKSKCLRRYFRKLELFKGRQITSAYFGNNDAISHESVSTYKILGRNNSGFMGVF